MDWIFVPAGDDYNSLDESFVIPSGSDSMFSLCYDVTILDDLAFEQDQVFFLHLTSSEDNVEILHPLIPVTVQDDDGMFSWCS